MTINNKYNVGENVVNRTTFKTGVVESVSTEDSTKVLVHYQDGFSEWVDCDSLSKLLLEVDPKPDRDEWGRENFLMNEDNNG